MSLATHLRSIPARVKRGVRFLSKGNMDWKYTVNRTTLDMADCKKCILGQSFRDYFVVRDTFGIDEKQMVKMGFGIPDAGIPNLDDEKRYVKALTQEWLKYVD